MKRKVLPLTQTSPAVAIAIAGIAGTLTWIAAMTAFFGPAQAILASPEHQSAKFLAVFGSIEPLPRMSGTPWILPSGLLVIVMIHSIVYFRIRGSLGRGRARRGARYGLVAWALMAPWFEFYLPWNVMHEPFHLVLLELLLWLLVLVPVGMVIAMTQDSLAPQAQDQTPAPC